MTSHGNNYGPYTIMGNKSIATVNYALNYPLYFPAETTFYIVKVTITDQSGKTRTRVMPVELVNRTGHRWEFNYSDYPNSSKQLSYPRADWKYGFIYQRPSKLNETYFKDYEKATGIRLSSNDYDVHHIQPLSYGGDNTYSNLVHLPPALHTQVTGWFKGY